MSLAASPPAWKRASAFSPRWPTPSTAPWTCAASWSLILRKQPKDKAQGEGKMKMLRRSLFRSPCSGGRAGGEVAPDIARYLKMREM